MNYSGTGAVIKTPIVGSRRLNNIFWAVIVSLGGFGFFVAGLSSFLKTDLFGLSSASEITFFPQGIVLLFYGTVGSLLGAFLSLTLFWNVGFGYNEYNKLTQTITLYRKSFPGTVNSLNLSFPFDSVKSIKMKIQEGLNPKRQLFLCLTDNREIPLTGLGEPIALTKLENEAITLAKYLNVFLETE